jgi:hypothetical protein
MRSKIPRMTAISMATARIARTTVRIGDDGSMMFMVIFYTPARMLARTAMAIREAIAVVSAFRSMPKISPRKVTYRTHSCTGPNSKSGIPNGAFDHPTWGNNS